MRKTIVKIVCVFVLINPWYVQAELDLSIPSENSVVTLSDSRYLTKSKTLPIKSSNGLQQSNFTISSARSSPVVLIAVAAVIALVVLKLKSEAEK